MSELSLRAAAEIREAPQAVQRQGAAIAAPAAALLKRLREKPPQVVVTCARGSSAHAATFGKHLIERHLGIPCAAAAPVIASIYRKPLRLSGQLFLAISQSGRSDDLVESARLARQAGAVTAAMVNETNSPLAAACEFVLPIEAGPEQSVAATKSFIATLAALLRVTAAWTGDAAMTTAIERLPGRLADAAELDWSAAAGPLASAQSLITIGRGPTLPIAREAALKFKETCNLHAEAFSGAEFLHGPVSLVSDLYPVLMFTPTDAAAERFSALAADLRGKGAAVFATSADRSVPGALPAVPPDHPDADAICLIQSLYAFVVSLSLLRGTSVDQPRHLRKVTSTR